MISNEIHDLKNYFSFNDVRKSKNSFNPGNVHPSLLNIKELLGNRISRSSWDTTSKNILSEINEVTENNSNDNNERITFDRKNLILNFFKEKKSVKPHPEIKVKERKKRKNRLKKKKTKYSKSNEHNTKLKTHKKRFSKSPSYFSEFISKNNKKRDKEIRKFSKSRNKKIERTKKIFDKKKSKKMLKFFKDSEKDTHSINKSSNQNIGVLLKKGNFLYITQKNKFQNQPYAYNFTQKKPIQRTDSTASLQYTRNKNIRNSHSRKKLKKTNYSKSKSKLANIRRKLKTDFDGNKSDYKSFNADELFNKITKLCKTKEISFKANSNSFKNFITLLIKKNIL